MRRYLGYWSRVVFWASEKMSFYELEGYLP